MGIHSPGYDSYSETRYFELFFSTWSIFSPYKNSALMTRISDTNMLSKTEKYGQICFFKTDQIIREYEKRYPSDKKRDYVGKWQTPPPTPTHLGTPCTQKMYGLFCILGNKDLLVFTKNYHFCKTCFSTPEWFWHAKNNLVNRHQVVGLVQTCLWISTT